MLVTIITMYRGHDAETFVHAVRGTLTDEQRDEWRKAHECDGHYDGDEDDMNNMFFRTMHLGENNEISGLKNADGEKDTPQAEKDKATLVKLPSVKVDCTDFEAADSDDMSGTTYYGGSIHVSNRTNVDVEIVCGGNDRGDDECRWPTMEAVADALGLVSPEHWDDELADELNRQIHPGLEFQVGLDGDRLVFLPVDEELTSFPAPPQKGNEPQTGESP